MVSSSVHEIFHENELQAPLGREDCASRGRIWVVGARRRRVFSVLGCGLCVDKIEKEARPGLRVPCWLSQGKNMTGVEKLRQCVEVLQQRFSLRLFAGIELRRDMKCPGVRHNGAWLGERRTKGKLEGGAICGAPG